jgi:hypothetical protein
LFAYKQQFESYDAAARNQQKAGPAGRCEADTDGCFTYREVGLRHTVRYTGEMGPEHLHWPQNLAPGVQLRTGARVRRLEPVIKRGPIYRPTSKA